MIVDGEVIDLGEPGLQTLLTFEDTTPISEFIELEVVKGEESVKVLYRHAGVL